MARTRYIWDPETRELVEIPTERDPSVRLHVQGVHEPFQSQADGKWYSSKAAYRADLRARGYEEVGNEKSWRGYEPQPLNRPSFEERLHRTAANMGK